MRDQCSVGWKNTSAIPSIFWPIRTVRFGAPTDAPREPERHASVLRTQRPSLPLPLRFVIGRRIGNMIKLALVPEGVHPPRAPPPQPRRRQGEEEAEGGEELE